jgi:hypothetical protein
MSKYKRAGDRGRNDARNHCRTNPPTEEIYVNLEHAAYSAAARLLRDYGSGSELDRVLGLECQLDIGPALVAYRQAWEAEVIRHLRFRLRPLTSDEPLSRSNFI